MKQLITYNKVPKIASKVPIIKKSYDYLSFILGIGFPKQTRKTKTKILSHNAPFYDVIWGFKKVV